MSDSLADIISCLPHGPAMVGIEKILNSTDNSLTGESVVGMVSYFLDEDSNLIPEACLELVGQAAAIGSGLQRKKSNALHKVKQGVIAKVRSFTCNGITRLARGTRLHVAVQWSEPVGGAYELTGTVVNTKAGTIYAQVDCTVLEIV